MLLVLHIGNWIIPALVTIGFFLAAWSTQDRTKTYGNNSYGSGALINAGKYLVALCASLLIWVIWFILVYVVKVL